MTRTLLLLALLTACSKDCPTPLCGPVEFLVCGSTLGPEEPCYAKVWVGDTLIGVDIDRAASDTLERGEWLCGERWVNPLLVE